MAKDRVFAVIQLQAEEEHLCSPMEMGLAKAVLWVPCWTWNSLEKSVWSLVHWHCSRSFFSASEELS